ncbi:dihydrofolate reductase [Heyndrickxia sporothermodurans]|uniref:dihydrofolate reductase n=1 Tax=Heyndrickxia sporothermodurans TaxID=46224 RepID=UPI000D35D91D|nr:dihydrofolate reductase [Heyndrickxia sporothermodurans]PTY93060.1 dihydrofolate reductase [Heyndrickxia sporothermodurans]
MLSILVTHDKHRVIGSNNQLPWHLPEGLHFLNKVTTKKTIIMGRKTFEAYGKPLPNRKTIVLTRDRNYRPYGVEVVRNFNLLKLCKDQPGEYFVIGGEELFRQALSIVDKLYVIYIDKSFDGDAYFPELPADEWELLSEKQGIKDEKNPYDYYFKTYIRRK